MERLNGCHCGFWDRALQFSRVVLGRDDLEMTGHSGINTGEDSAQSLLIHIMVLKEESSLLSLWEGVGSCKES